MPRRTLLFALLFILMTCMSASGTGALCLPDMQALNVPDKTFNYINLKKQSILPDLLEWRKADNLCGGYFYEPETITAFPNPLPIDQTETTITATGQSVFRQNGPSTVEGNVTFTQPGREVTADKVVLHRDPQTDEISCADLYGNVRFREAGKMLVGSYTHIDLKDNTWQVSEGVYHVDRPSKNGSQSGWGLVQQAVRERDGVLQLSHASYTTCAPTQTPWHIKAEHITINKETGRGTANNAWFYAGNTPLLYTPYANFPIDNRRYSGFLYPSFAYNSQSGFVVDIPYYFNLAPNYDATLTLTPMTQRGIQMSGLFRYLTESSAGYLNTSVLPSDAEFARFKSDTFQDNSRNSYTDPFLDALDNDSDTRSAIAFHDTTIWNQNWSGSLDINLVSDDYYFQDFGTGPVTLNTDQLLNQGVLNYQGEHWQFLARLQAYQTLHVINNVFVDDQYERLPQLVLNGRYPDQPYGMNYELSTEWVNFQHPDDFFTGQAYPTGTRLHISPQASRPFTNAYSYSIPTAILDITSYSVSNNAIVNTLYSPPIITPSDDPNLDKTRVLPLLSLDNGLYFERRLNIWEGGYRQTLEPRLMYLYVPLKNQDDIPVFDTTLPTFDYDQVFRMNRFVGYDRVGDANQMAFGITSRFLDDYTGVSKLDLGIGGIYYLQPHRVCLYPDCSDDPTIGQSISPIAGQATFRPNSIWSVIGNAAWDPDGAEWENAGVRLLYTPLPQHIFKVAYNYVQDGDLAPGTPSSSSKNNLQRIDVGASFAVKQDWNLFADWNYNISHQNTQSYLYGIEYNSCCLAVRLVADRAWIAEDVNGSNNYRSNFYIQFLLKGLGTLGNQKTGDLIVNALPGYQDIFQ